MRLSELDETLTPVPIDVVREVLGETHETAVLPVRDQGQSTACVLVATRRTLLIAFRIAGASPHGPPGAVVESVDWRDVSIGPFGLCGRVPGGLLGGAESSVHLLTVVAGNRAFQARVRGIRGPEAIELFATAARRAGARDSTRPIERAQNVAEPMRRALDSPRREPGRQPRGDGAGDRDRRPQRRARGSRPAER